MSKPLILDEQTIEFINLLHRGGKHRFTQDLAGKPHSYWSRVDEPLRLPPNYHGAAIYFGINPTTVRVTDEDRKKYPRFADQYIEQWVGSKDRTIACINCLYREFDAKDLAPSHDAFVADVAKYKAMVLDHVNRLSPAPTVIIDSGGGYQCYWILDEPFYLRTPDDRDKAKDMQRRWVEMDKRADQNVKDIRRVFRIPGTTNYKEAYAPNFPTATVINKDF